MRKSMIMSAVAAGTLMLAGTAQADDHEGDGAKGPSIYSWTGSVEASLIGGVGPKGDQYVGATWTEDMMIKTADGTMVTVKSQCVGMSQPDRRPFQRHISCDLTGRDGASGSSVMGCNPDVAPRTMRCMGTFDGKEGSIKGKSSLITAFYTFGEDGSGKVQGSGLWTR